MAERLGLISAGPVSRNFIWRIPALAGRLGPVMSTSPALASRLVNAMRAGRPVESYQAFAKVPAILVCAQDELLPKLVEETAAADVDWRSKTFLLCASALDSSLLLPLAARGAWTGSLGPIEGLDDLGLFVEGDKEAVLEARRLMRHGHIRVHQLRSSKALCLAGISFSASLALPLLDASVRCLRAAGLNTGVADLLAQRSFQKTVRAFLQRGKKSAVAPDNRAALERQLETLRQTDPQLACLFAQMLAALKVDGE
jgi:hypothetical protein